MVQRDPAVGMQAIRLNSGVAAHGMTFGCRDSALMKLRQYERADGYVIFMSSRSVAILLLLVDVSFVRMRRWRSGDMGFPFSRE